MSDYDFTHTDYPTSQQFAFVVAVRPLGQLDGFPEKPVAENLQVDDAHVAIHIMTRRKLCLGVNVRGPK